MPSQQPFHTEKIRCNY